MSPPELTLDSHKERLAEGFSYLLGAMDLHAVLASRLTHSAVLEVSGRARQADRKEQRDAIEAQGRYRVLELWCRPKHAGRRSQLDDAQTIEAVLTAVPRSAIKPGTAARPHLRALLTDCLAAVAPKGIFVGNHPDCCWRLSIVLDSKLGTLEADLQSTLLGTYVVKHVAAMTAPGGAAAASPRAAPRRQGLTRWGA